MRRSVLRQLSLRSGAPIRPSSTLFASRSQQQSARSSAPTSLASQLQARRWYADNATEKAVEADVAAKGNDAAPSEVEKAKAELEEKKKEALDFKDKYLRSVADFRNLQERTKREQASARDFAITRFAKDLVESIDNLDRALDVVPADALKDGANKDLKNLYDGLKMTENILMSTLAKHGLERFDPSVNGDKFDPNRHDAQFMTKMEGKEDGTVFNTIQKGFVLNGRVIRAAKVGVVKNT